VLFALVRGYGDRALFGNFQRTHLLSTSRSIAGQSPVHVDPEHEKLAILTKLSTVQPSFFLALGYMIALISRSHPLILFRLLDCNYIDGGTNNCQWCQRTRVDEDA